VLSDRFEVFRLAYCEVADVKTILQVATEDESLDDAIEAAITSADGLIDSLLKHSGLAVPSSVPQNILDASAHFTAWLIRKHADPTGAEAFWVEAQRFLQAFIDSESEPAFLVGSSSA
jgi:hypothetical protein